MIDQLQEILATLKKNRMRTVLTGLSVSWGIFILIVLLGAGNGLKHGVMLNFSHRAINRIGLWPGATSMPWQGLKSERNLYFTESEVDLITNEVEESRLITARTSTTQTIAHGDEYGSYQVLGVMPGFFHIENMLMSEGRFVNQLDMKEKNKVVVLDAKVAERLFKDKSPLGEYVKVGQLMFKVVGVAKKAQWEGFNAYIPFTAAQAIFNPGRKFYQITFTVDGLITAEENERFDKSLREILAQRLNFNPDDRQALWVSNSQAEYVETMKIFGGITILVSIIGILTLIAGIVGVSNIMLVSVKERTREIGIRKAIGATPASILKTIILESILITTVFGYIGMIAGIGLTEAVNFVMQRQATTNEMQMTVFADPTVDLGYALFATAILIAAGVIAGYLPARKAVKVKPIEAMKQE
jgi:putative ABC transport system permease protein